MSDIITNIEKYRQGWKGGLPETPCGSGSKLSNTVAQREWIPQIMEFYDVETIADIGAGDLNWVREMDLSKFDYSAYDLVPRDPSVRQLNLIEDEPPAVDCLWCLWVLNHMPIEACRMAMHNMYYSGSKYLLMTDRPIWHDEQPPELHRWVKYRLEELQLNEKGDRIVLIDLESVKMR